MVVGQSDGGPDGADSEATAQPALTDADVEHGRLHASIQADVQDEIRLRRANAPRGSISSDVGVGTKKGRDGAQRVPTKREAQRSRGIEGRASYSSCGPKEHRDFDLTVYHEEEDGVCKTASLVR